MVSMLLVLCAALLPSNPSPAIGVVRVARQQVSIGRGVELRPARSADLVRDETVIETGSGGWAEVELFGKVRVRVSAATHLQIERKEEELELNLESGRIWVELMSKTPPLSVVTPNARAFISPSSSAIVELDRASGTVVVTRAGEAMLASSTSSEAPLKVGRGQIANVQFDTSRAMAARPGGDSLADVVALESKANLGDLIGLKAFLLSRVSKAKVNRFLGRGVQQIIRTDPEVTGGDAGPAGAAVEGGLRPPPFFENEVPPRGPNVKVKVTYGD